MLLVESVPHLLAEEIATNLDIPVIGIGAGSGCDGQILVLQDLLGITPGKVPSFAKNFMSESDDIRAAISRYVDDVRQRKFPSAEHSFS